MNNYRGWGRERMTRFSLEKSGKEREKAPFSIKRTPRIEKRTKKKKKRVNNSNNKAKNSPHMSVKKKNKGIVSLSLFFLLFCFYWPVKMLYV